VDCAAGVAAASPKDPSVPAIGQYDAVLAPPVTGAEKAKDDAKQDLASASYKTMLAQWGALKASVSDVTYAAATSDDLGVPRYDQVIYYYCGPTTAVMVTDYLDVPVSGSTVAARKDRAAYLLGTTEANGTGWTGSDNVPYYPGTSSYPVQDLFNYKLYQASLPEWYTPKNVAWPVPSGAGSTYKSNLVYDVSTGTSTPYHIYFPLALNQWASDQQGQPKNLDNHLPYQDPGHWQHWLVARGYASSGDHTYVNDPAWGPAKAEVLSVGSQSNHGIVWVVSGRGYIW
jgi:hypothetical protein